MTLRVHLMTKKHPGERGKGLKMRLHLPVRAASVRVHPPAQLTVSPPRDRNCRINLTRVQKRKGKVDPLTEGGVAPVRKVQRGWKSERDHQDAQEALSTIKETKTENANDSKYKTNLSNNDMTSHLLLHHESSRGTEDNRVWRSRNLLKRDDTILHLRLHHGNSSETQDKRVKRERNLPKGEDMTLHLLSSRETGGKEAWTIEKRSQVTKDETPPHPGLLLHGKTERQEDTVERKREQLLRGFLQIDQERNRGIVIKTQCQQVERAIKDGKERETDLVTPSLLPGARLTLMEDKKSEKINRENRRDESRRR